MGLGMTNVDLLCGWSALENKDFHLSSHMECGSPGSDFG